MPILKRYKNQLLERITQADFQPQQFRVDDIITNNLETFQITFKAFNRLTFQIRNPPHTFHEFDCRYVSFSPGIPVSGPFPLDGFADINRILPRFESWLASLRDYLEDQITPDLWSQIDTHSAIIGAPPKSDNQDTFSDEEKTQVQLSIQEFRVLITETYKPTEQQLESIDARLEYLSQSVNRLNKFDWKGVVISTLIGIATTLSLDTQSGRLLLQLFLQATRSISHLLTTGI